MKIPPFLEKFMQKLGQGENKKPMTAKEKWMLFLLSGLLLAVIVFPAGDKKSDGTNDNTALADYRLSADDTGQTEYAPGSGTMTLNQYEVYLSRQLEAILSQIDGAGQVEAWVTLASSSEKIFFQEKDSDTTSLEEADSVGGTRVEETSNIDKTVVTDSSGNPYVVKTLQPEVEGVLIVAEGAGDSTIKKNISEAAQVLFGIDAHRIKVAKKKVEE